LLNLSTTVSQRCAIHKSRNLQKHLAKKYRKEAHRLLMNALEQEEYADARSMLKELEKGCIPKK
jgi:transposase-like protein